MDPLDLRSQPPREEVLEKLLATGAMTREQASQWAVQWLTADDEPDNEVRVTDVPAWHALMSLGGADLQGGNRPYLYNARDFRSWAEELNDA